VNAMVTFENSTSGPSGDADLQRGWPLSLKWRGGSVAGNAGLADDY
jgi:hypothetical protein